MNDQIKQLNKIIQNLSDRVAQLEREKINYTMPDYIRKNVQRAVVAGTQYLGNLSGATNPVNESVPSYLQLSYEGALWNVSCNAFVASGKGAPTFNAPQGAMYLRTDWVIQNTPWIYVNQNGGTSWYGYILNANIIAGGGIPGISAPKGTIFTNTNATTATTRLYVNTDGGNTWANFTASA